MVVRDGVASLQAGGGIVADSTPEGEYAESFHKMRALVRAIERAEQIESSEAGIAERTAGDDSPSDDNYDSFTYNLYQALAGLGANVEVVRNDQIDGRGVFGPNR